MSDDPLRPTPGFGTRAIRAATTPPRVAQAPTTVPIYQTATFGAADPEELGDILGGRQAGFAYSRIQNPSASAMAAAIAELEGAEAGQALGSGMAAIHAALVSVLSAGDRVVAGRACYGSTRALLDGLLARLGVETEYVDASDPDAVDSALASGPVRVLYLETISNPTIVVADLAELIWRAHRRDVVVIVDNTFASPYLCRPIELGADLVVESCTKWLGGHSDVIAGAVVGSRQRMASLLEAMTDTGGIAAPFSAFLVLRGLATLHVRMERHCSTAFTLARQLESAEDVRAVYYPGLASHPHAAVAQRELRAGGGMLAFDLGDRAAARAFIAALEVPPLTASLGSVQTIAVHPPSTTHRQLDDAQLAASGIPPGLVRVSVGLEDPEDLIADFTAGLAAARLAMAAA